MTNETGRGPAGVALITGASGAIGRAVARALAPSVDIVVNYWDDPEGARWTVKHVEEAGGRALAAQADVRDVGALQRLVDEAERRFGRVSILVNNAGIVRDRTVAKMSDSEWRDVLDVNLTGAFNATRAVLPGMMAARYGRIVSISSVVATAGAFGQTNYAASKAGLLGFTRALALETARYDITANAVCPGYTESPMLSTVPQLVREELLARIPKGRFARPEDVAGAVAFLASREAGYITGHALNVNGGYEF